MITGMPAAIWLNKFGVIVRDYFGHVPYQVGSSLTSKDWRDVDVRLILPDEEFTARFGSLRVSEADPGFAAITPRVLRLDWATDRLPDSADVEGE